MQEQKKYHQRKLAIIEMIELCDGRIMAEQSWLNRFPDNGIEIAFKNSDKNIKRYECIKQYLIERYKRQ